MTDTAELERRLSEATIPTARLEEIREGPPRRGPSMHECISLASDLLATRTLLDALVETAKPALAHLEIFGQFEREGKPLLMSGMDLTKPIRVQLGSVIAAIERRNKDAEHAE